LDRLFQLFFVNSIASGVARGLNQGGKA